MSLLKSINDKWCRFQGELFPEIGSEVGPLTKKYELFVYVLEMVYGSICIKVPKPPQEIPVMPS